MASTTLPCRRYHLEHAPPAGRLDERLASLTGIRRSRSQPEGVATLRPSRHPTQRNHRRKLNGVIPARHRAAANERRCGAASVYSPHEQVGNAGSELDYLRCPRWTSPRASASVCRLTRDNSGSSSMGVVAASSISRILRHGAGDSAAPSPLGLTIAKARQMSDSGHRYTLALDLAGVGVGKSRPKARGWLHR